MPVSPAPTGLVALAIDWRWGGRTVPARFAPRRAEFLRTATYGFAVHRERPFVTDDAGITTAVLRDAGGLPELVWDLEGWERGARVGWGLGLVHGTGHRDVVRAEAAARAALATVHASGRLALAAAGDLPAHVDVIGGLGALLARHRAQFTKGRWRIADLARADLTQGAIARERRVTKQAVSQELRAMGWAVYRAGERAWRQSFVLAGLAAGEPPP